MRTVHYIAGVAFLAVALRMTVAMVALREEPRYSSPDSNVYRSLAESLADGRGFAFGGSPTYYRVPGYPAILAVAIRLFGRGADTVVLIGQAISIVVPIGALWWLLSWVRTEQTGAPIAAAALLALDPANLGHSAMLLSDSYFCAMSGLVVAIGIASLYRGTSWLGFLAGVASGVAALIHPSANYVWAAGVVTHLGLNERPWRRRVVLASLMLAGHALVLTPWMLRNYALFGDPSLAKVRDQGLALKAGLIESYALGDSPRGLFGFLNGSFSDGEVTRLYRERHASDRAHAHTQLFDVALRYPGATAAVGLASLGVLYLDPCHGILLRALGEPRGTGFLSRTSGGFSEALRSRPLATVLTAFSVGWMAAFWACVAIGVKRWARQAPLVLGFCFLYCAYYSVVFSFGALSAGGRYRLAMLPALVLLATPALGARLKSVAERVGPAE